MTNPSEPFPVVSPESAQLPEIDANIAATGRLLDVLRAEVQQPQAVITTEQEFADDGSFDLRTGPSLSEIASVDDPHSSYLAGLRPSDGAGQIILVERKNGTGVTGRVTMTLREGEPTLLFGRRQVPDASDVPRKQLLEGQPATPELLDQLGTDLAKAFDAKRATINAQDPKRLRGLAKQAVASLVRRGGKDVPALKRHEIEK